MAETNWRKEAADDAKSAAEHFKDEIIDSIIDAGGPTKDVDIYDYSDSYHHENHVDRSYRLVDAAHIIDDLDEFEETDSGLWEGQAPREAIATMAAFTYGNAVASMFRDLLEKINEEVDGIHFDFKEWMEDLETGGRRGVLDWVPKATDEEEDEDEFQERLEKDHEEYVKKSVTEAVEKAISNW